MTTTAIPANVAPATSPTDPSAGTPSTPNNVVALRTASQATNTATTQPQADPVLSARTKAYESIATFVNDTNARIAKYDKQREAALAVLREPKPEPPMKMGQEEWNTFLQLKTQAMANWNNGANDRGGHNGRESNAINQLDNTLTTNAKYLTLDQAKDLLAKANEAGLQSHGGNFEDGSWQGVFNAVRSYSVPAQTEYDNKLADWKQRQETAKMELSNVTNLLGSTQDKLGKTVVAFNDMMQKDAVDQTRLMTRQLLGTPSMQPKVEKENTDKDQQVITVSVNDSAVNKTKGKANAPVNVKVTVNVDKDLNAQQFLAARAEPLSVSSRFGQG